MLTLRFEHLFLILLITLVAFAGCGRSENITMDSVSTADIPMSEMEATPVKMVWFINFPEGGKDAYDNWVLSIAETLLAPEELVRSSAYNNVDPEMRPHRYVELEFESYLAAATYMNRPEIAAVLQASTNHITDQTVYTFIRRSNYSKNEVGDLKIKHVHLVDYPLSGKQAYLDWVASGAPPLIEQPQLKAIETYDNYYGESPHRLTTVEFESVADSDAYLSLDGRKAFDAEVGNYAHSWVMHRFEFISGYVRE